MFLSNFHNFHLLHLGELQQTFCPLYFLKFDSKIYKIKYMNFNDRSEYWSCNKRKQKQNKSNEKKKNSQERLTAIVKTSRKCDHSYYCKVIKNFPQITCIISTVFFALFPYWFKKKGKENLSGKQG